LSKGSFSLRIVTLIDKDLVAGSEVRVEFVRPFGMGNAVDFIGLYSLAAGANNSVGVIDYQYAVVDEPSSSTGTPTVPRSNVERGKVVLTPTAAGDFVARSVANFRNSISCLFTCESNNSLYI
jgi:hypothetical protein